MTPGTALAVKLGRGVVPPLQGLSGHTTDLRFRLTLPETADERHFVTLQVALECLCKIDEYHLKRGLRGEGPLWPPLYASGVVYREEEDGYEDWLDVPAVFRQGFADCEDLCAWRVAELRVAGVECEPVLRWRWFSREQMRAVGRRAPGGGVWMVHCLVRFPDGSIEDPSKVLGMGGSYTESV